MSEYIYNVNAAKGEISALIHSEELFNFLENSDEKVFIDFFVNLEKDYDLDINSLDETLKKYTQNRDYNSYRDIKKISETKRSEIFRRLNSSTKGTIKLVRLREKLLNIINYY